MVRKIVTVGILVCLGCLPSAAGDGIDGRWEGTLSFREAIWQVRIAFERQDETLKATLDLPDLVLAGEPLAVIDGRPAVRVRFPFGIGELELAHDGDRIRSTRKLGEADSETMRLELTRAAVAPYLHETIFVESSGTRLAGTLLLPRAKTRRPAVVIVHGSGAGDRTRWSYRSWADFYARRGVAALIYDRRGQGESTGDASGDRHFELLARDAVAAVEFLAAREEIDPGRIGVAGGSQGAWVASLAATRTELVSWLVLSSAAAVSPAEQEMQRAVHTMRADGIGEASIQDALAYLRLYFYTAHTGEGWQELRRAIERAGEAPWLDHVDQPERPEQLEWWHNHHDFEPATVLTRIDLPVLAFYGERDTVVPFARNEGLLRHYLEQGGAELTVERLPGADHRLEVPMGGVEGDRWDWPRIAPGVFRALDVWLESR